MKKENKEIIEAKVIEKNEKSKVEKEIKDSSTRIFPRFGAYVIDMFIIAILISLITSIRFLNPHYEEYQETYEKYSEYYTDYLNGSTTLEEYTNNTDDIMVNLYKYGFTNYIIALVVVIGYFVIFQKYNKGQTIGKKLFKLKVVSLENNDVAIDKYLLRIFPMYIISYGGIFSLISCILFPYILSVNVFAKWISAVTIANTLLGFIDAEFAIIRKDKRAFHDIISNTKVIDE